MRQIEDLVGFRGRGAGTDAERRAANHLAEELQGLGRDVVIEPTDVWPRYSLAHLIHALMAIAASILSVAAPLAAVALAALATMSALGDITGRLLLVRRVTGRRASQDVLSREGGDRPGALVIVAHYDAGRSGLVFSRRWIERRARLGKRLRRPLGLAEPFFWSIAVVLACSLLRQGGIESLALDIPQFLATALLILSVPLLIDVGLSEVVPGASHNASGAATALRLADRYGDTLEHLDLWVLLPGAGESAMPVLRRWLRRHRGELDPASTIFLGLDGVGHGTVRYARREGALLTSAYHPALLEICDELAAGDDDFGARGLVSRSPGDVHGARTKGYPAVAISCRSALDYPPHYRQPTDTPDRIEPAALERAYGFCCELIELIDERIGPRLEGGDAG